jgi:hypothetical protein
VRRPPRQGPGPHGAALTRKAYHRDPARNRTSASRARSPRDAARRLALRCGLLQTGQRAHLTRAGSRWLLLTPDGQAWRLDLRAQDYEPDPDLLAARQWVRRNLRGLRLFAATYRNARSVQDWMDDDGLWYTIDVVRAACRGLHRLHS